jgi:hypothetical protein
MRRDFVLPCWCSRVFGAVGPEISRRDRPRAFASPRHGLAPHHAKRTFRRLPTLCAFASLALLAARAAWALPAVEVQRDFTITAGNAFFDQGPSLGIVCTFNFGDPTGAYNILTGYNAAHIYQTPGTYQMTLSRIGEPDFVKTIHVVPDKRGVQTLQKGDILADVIRGVKNDTVVLLPPGATFDIISPIEVKSRNVEFRAAPGEGPMPRIRKIYGGKASNSLILHGLDITFRGIEFDSDRDMKKHGDGKVNIRGITADTAHVVLDHCAFRNVDDAIFCTTVTRGLLVQNCKFTNEVRSCDVWAGGADLVLLGNTMATSEHEHNCRQSYPGFYNMLVYENEMHATHGKETLTFRLGQDLYASHNLFDGWLRLGPGPRGDHRPMSPEELQRAFVRYVVIERNAFIGRAATIQINEGTSEAIIRYNRLDTDSVGVPIRAQGPSLHDIVLDGNYRVLTAGANDKPIFRGWGIGPNDIIEKNSSTKTAAEAEQLKGE